MKQPIDEQYIRAAELAARYLQGSISSEELEELAKLSEKYPTLQTWLHDRDVHLEKLTNRTIDYQSIDIEDQWQSVLKKRNDYTLPKRSLKIWRLMAASVIAVCLIGGGLFLENNDKSKLSDTKSNDVELVPGREVATLTLPDGSTVQLGETGENKVRVGNVMLDASGSILDYHTAKDTEVHIHKLHVPLGGTYQVLLADGTKVWLNADSDLEYPSVFLGKERNVKVRGEAYFEVAKDSFRPFSVTVGDTEVEALGTAFNINTHLYQGKIKTILTEGKIRVSSQNQSKIIEPGYETISGDGNIEVAEADMEEALAWKEGYFYFNSKSLKEVLEDIARWYNVEVDVQVPLSGKRYMGGIRKSESISAVCSVLSDLTSYTIAVENQKIIVK